MPVFVKASIMLCIYYTLPQSSYLHGGQYYHFIAEKTEAQRG